MNELSEGSGGSPETTPTQVAMPPQRVLRVQMIGGPGVGKTSFLAALGLIAQTPRNQLTITLVGDQTKRRLETLSQSIKHGVWPTKTVHGESFVFQLHRRRHSVTIEIDDIAGESFVASMRHGNADDAAARTSYLIEHCDLLLLMIDGGRLDSDDPLPESELIQAVSEKNRAAKTPTTRVAVIVTKADLCIRYPVRTASQAKARVQQRMPALTDFLHHHTAHISWIPVSVCGFGDHLPLADLPSQSHNTDSKQPSDCAARGNFSPTGFEPLLDLFLAIADQRRLARRRVVLVISIAAIFLGAAIFKYRDYEVAQQQRQIENPNLRVQDFPGEVAVANESLYRGRVLEWIRAANDDIQSASTPREVDAVLMRVADLPTAATRLAADELTAIEINGRKRKETLLFATVAAAEQTGDAIAIGAAVDQYLKNYPSGPNAPHARSLLSKQEDKRRSRAREEIESVIVRDAATLERKLELIVQYLDQFDAVVSPVEGDQMRIAIDAARTMLRPSQYDITLVRTAGLDRPRAHGVAVAVDSNQIALFDDSGTVSEKIWNRTFNLRWQLGNRVEVTMLNFRYRNNPMAYFDSPSPLSILVLARKSQPTRYGEAYLTTQPPVTITMKCEQLPEETVTAIEQWIFPGNAW